MVEDVSVKVSSVSKDVMAKLTDLVVQLKKAAADGIDLKDIPVAVNVAMMDLLPAIGELNKIGPEYTENRVACKKAFALGAVDLEEAVFGL